MKKCTACHQVKNTSLFSNRRSQCKECRKKYLKKYNAQNKNVIKLNKAKWYERNKPRIKKLQSLYSKSLAGKIASRKNYLNNKRNSTKPLRWSKRSYLDKYL